MQDIYQYEDYKKYLKDLCLSVGGRGYKAALAEAAGCQRSFLSQSLNGSVHLTAEHAVGLTKFLNLNETQTIYFEAMVGWARAGSSSTRLIYHERMKKIRLESKNLAKRFDTKVLETSEAAFTEYYSSANYSLMHLLLTIPQCRTVEALAVRLRKSNALVHETLQKLKQWGLADNSKGSWHTTQKQVHIPREHPMVSVHHRNFRDAANQSDSLAQDYNVRYSAIYTMSEKDVEILKQMTIEFVERTRKLVSSSQEQEAVIFNLDLVKI